VTSDRRSVCDALVAALLLTLLLEAPAFAATLRGTIADPDGRPVPSATVMVVGPAGTAASAVSDRAGAFRLDRLPAGRFELIVVKPGFRADPITVDLGQEDDRQLAIQLRISPLTESVVVTAAHVDLPLSRASDTITVVSRDDLERRQIDTLAGALRLIPGLSVIQTGGPNGIVSLFPRGGESDYTLVLVDGVKVNAVGGGFDFSELPVHDIERIEFVRGPESAVFGSDAVGGVVHVVTRLGGPRSTEGLMETGGLGGTRAAVGATGSLGRWSLAASAERSGSDGFTGSAPASGERVTNDDASHMSGGGRVAWRADNGVEARASLRATGSDRGFAGPYGSNPIGAFPGVDRVSRGESTSVQAGAQLSLPFSGFGRGGRQLVQFGHFRGDNDFTSPYGLSQSSSTRWSLRAQTDLAVTASFGFSTGLEVQRERATSTFITAAEAGPVPVTRLVAGWFAEGRYQPSARLSMSGGLRLDRIRRDRLAESPDPFSPRPAFGAGVVTSANPRVSLAYVVRPAGPGGQPGRPILGSTRVRVAAGTGIRPPDALEIAFTDNPDLKPERSRSAEIGLEQWLVGDAARLEVTAFRNSYDDLIVAVGRAMADASRYRTDNIANAVASGVEVGVASRTAFGLEVRAAYTFLATSVRAVDGGSGQAPPPFSVGDWLIRRPRHQATLDIVLARPRYTLSAQAGARGRVLDIEPNWGAFGGLFGNPGYAVVNAGVAVRLVHGVELLARGNNLFDRTYEEAFGFPAPGRVGTIGVRVALGR